MSEYALEMLDVTKTFSKVTALNHVDLKVKEGEIHALIGENGAGKSTLMKVLAGVYQADSGTVRIFGKEMHFHKPQDAIDKGIAIIYQELSLIPDLVIGGTSMAGGRGSLICTLAGVLIMAVMNNILNLLGVNPYLQIVIKGLIILVAVLIQKKNK